MKNKTPKSVKTLVASLMSFMCACCVFAGCSTTSDQSSAPDGAVVIKTSYPNQGDAESKIMLKVKNAFETKMAQEGKKISVLMQPIDTSSYNSDMLKGWNTESLPDVIYTTDTLSSPFAKLGVFENLDPYFEKSKIDLNDYDAIVMESTKAYQDNIYYVPRSSDCLVVFCNLDMFNKYEIELPDANDFTWTQMQNLCAQFRTAFNNDTSIPDEVKGQYLPLDVVWSWEAVSSCFIRSFGGYIFDPETGKAGFDTEGTKKALEKMAYFASNQYATPVHGQGGSYNSRKAAMRIMSRPAVSNFEHFGVANCAFLPFPQFDDEFTGGGEGTGSYWSFGSTGWALNSKGKNKDAAWEFMQFIISEEGQRLLSSTGTSVPILKKLQAEENAEWKTCFNFLKDVDQSAFVWDENKDSKYTRMLTVYARGFDPELESTIYQQGVSLIKSFSSTYKYDTNAFLPVAQKSMMDAIS